MSIPPGRPLMVDTSALYAAADPADPRRSAVRATLLRYAGAWVTTSAIVAEYLTLARARRGHLFAVRTGGPLAEGRLAPVLRPTPEDEATAWTIFKRHALCGLSFVDCLTIAAMRRLRIRRLLTFDANFAALGLPVAAPEA